MAKDHGPQIKDDERYEKLRAQGMRKEKAARIANTPRQVAAKRGDSSPPMSNGARRICTAKRGKSASTGARRCQNNS